MRFSRTINLIGEDLFKCIQDKTVLIIGLGGVGGYALEAIARSGVQNIIIVDHDLIDESNINRQILALNSTIGKTKVDVAEIRIKEINDNINVIKYQMMFNDENKDIILNNKIDYCIDCFDTITYKIVLIEECFKRGIKLITCCGTGNKFNPLKLQIIKLEKTSVDPIAKVLRYKLKDKPYYHKIMCLSSTEYPKKQPKLDDSGIRKKMMPPSSNSYVPATAGIILASYVINDIIK